MAHFLKNTTRRNTQMNLENALFFQLFLALLTRLFPRFSASISSPESMSASSYRLERLLG